MADLSLDDITKRIVDAILEERQLSRENLSVLVRPLLKIWLKKADSFKSHKACKSKLQMTIEQKEFEQQYWRSKFRELVGNEKIIDFYSELDKLLVKEGFK